MKKIFYPAVLSALLLIVLLASCGRAGYTSDPPTSAMSEIESATPSPEPSPLPSPPADDPPEETAPEYSSPAYSPDDLFTSGRTRGDYLDDLDFLYNTLVENFPFMGVIYRSIEVDLHYHYISTRRRIETIDDIRSDGSFVLIINSGFISHARQLGHFGMLNRDSVRFHAQIFNNAQWDAFIPFVDELNNPATRTLHRLTDEDFEPPTQGEDSFVYATWSQNIQTRIIEEGKIAYVNIQSMSSATMELDRITLLDFFREVADYEHLIIDIRQNGGGDSRFFPELVIAPNIGERLYFDNYVFIMGGDHNRQMLRYWFFDFSNPEESPFNPVNDALIARLPNLNPEDAAILDYYFNAGGFVDPTHGNGIFGGKIWLLVSERVFSASEAAAAMVKQTGFATLVGTTTGGDGIGINPLMLALPNTGIIVRYSSLYGTDANGRNNQEFGTDPHIFNHPGLDALQTVLEIIEELQIQNAA